MRMEESQIDGRTERESLFPVSEQTHCDSSVLLDCYNALRGVREDRSGEISGVTRGAEMQPSCQALSTACTQATEGHVEN
ncbi:hypothetical protein KUCAC02_014400 [Chaenocephalus aceratus]|uniref:Uncharacterized protein n=1 Tax=Chaenocephalus aceratus TaxID=36190 RepID=A0ACB9WFD1_CHAAC|nr:hypothetical protein KUCAC02_014400 [Chaenocephalus aceratus]